MLAVVLFQLGFSGLKLGFLGVDVFFVISGFLMAILCGRSTAKQFFERRARRLLPAYFVTIFVVLVASVLWVLPTENNQVTESSLYAAVFASNIGFWLQNSYFSKADFTPLLHLWSLGVEIQFYLVAPLLHYLGRRFRWMLPVLLVVSLFAFFAMTSVSSKTSFLMMPLRAWQFLIGWLIAWYLTNNGTLRIRSWNALAGLRALLSCVLCRSFLWILTVWISLTGIPVLPLLSPVW